MTLHITQHLIVSVAAFASVLPGVSACSGDGASRINAGQEVAEIYCIRCHAIGEFGESPMKAAPPFRKLNEKYAVEDSAEVFATGILVGHEEMPAFQFNQNQIDSLFAYLKSVQSE